LGGAFVVLLGLTLAAYHPAWTGGRLWDDDAHLTPATLQSLHGLWRIWFDLGATQQYYPVAHSAFWLMHRLWGDNTLGYHLVNITLHATSAFLVLAILRRLAVPGAALAALVFAVHPLQVESVAWMTELKNTLSGTLYFSAALAYLEFDARHLRRWYAVALGLFCLALLAKTVTATLPAALLVVFWWQRNHLRWREDIVPLAPFFVLGIASGAGTAWLEHTLIGAAGPAFQLSPIDRGLIAGRALWFYLGKLVWPSNLMFTYPRWQVSSAVWWQYLFPASAVLLCGGLYAWRRRSRAPLAAFLLFAGTLFPALGFVNVYPFVFSFVADHFQYLANVGVIALLAAAVVVVARRWNPAVTLDLTDGLSAVGLAILVLVGTPLTILTWRQSREYADAETLYRATLARNPASWLAYNNLGLIELASVRRTPGSLIDPGSAPSSPESTQALEAALDDFHEALRLNPDLSQAENNIGAALLGLGRFKDAQAAFAEAVRLKPSDAEIRTNLAVALLRLGQPTAAVPELLESVRLDPNRAASHEALASALLTEGESTPAIAEYRTAIRLSPATATAHTGLATALGRAGQPQAAIAEYEEALRLDPRDARADANLGVALLRTGQLQEAADRFRMAVAIDPTFARGHYGLASALDALGRHDEAIAEFRQTLVYQPDFAEAHNELGVALAEVGRSQEAIAEFLEAIRLKPDLTDARANLVRARGGLIPAA
jgi:tetratricopeptide (TPR) repeat protein